MHTIWIPSQDREIIVRRAENGEKFVTLDGQERDDGRSGSDDLRWQRKQSALPVSWVAKIP